MRWTHGREDENRILQNRENIHWFATSWHAGGLGAVGVVGPLMRFPGYHGRFFLIGQTFVLLVACRMLRPLLAVEELSSSAAFSIWRWDINGLRFP